jgi:beta-galactosidase/beta-glucuronidase
VDLSVANQTADVSVFVEIEGERDGVSIAFTILDQEQKTVATKSIELSASGPFSAQFKVENASFWWPVGLGKHPLYTVKAELIHEVILL